MQQLAAAITMQMAQVAKLQECSLEESIRKTTVAELLLHLATIQAMQDDYAAAAAADASTQD